MGYLDNILVSIDQLGNAVAGGDADNTISSRIGYYNHHRLNHGGHVRKEDVKWYWRWFETIVDTTFRPKDGDGHCHEAYHNDAGETFDPNTKNWAVGVLSILIVGTCIPLFVLFRVASFLGMKQRDVDAERPESIRKRLGRIDARLNALIHEIDENPEYRGDAATLQLCEAISDKINKIRKEIESRGFTKDDDSETSE